MSVMNAVEAKNKSQLTERQKSIIQILTKSSAARPITVGMISEDMGVSSRTILREIPTVEQWLTQNDFHLIRKPSVGLILDESVENKRLILELLEVESVYKAYPKQERQRRILGELLYAKEPVKSYYFTSKFHISEGTLTSDLNQVSEWLKTYHIHLIRRPGVGIFLRSAEENYRQAIANVIYENMDEQTVTQLICGGELPEKGSSVPVQNRVFDLLDNSMMARVEQILVESERQLHIRYADSAYIGLIVHIALAIQRIQNGENIEMEPERLQQLMMQPEFSIAEEMADRLMEAFQITIPKGEIGYITMHLCSSQMWSGSNRARNMDQVALRQMAVEMIALVEKELDIPLSDDDSLLEDFCTHLAPAVSRMTMGIHIENTQLETLRAEYPQMMVATDNACQHVLCRELGIDHVPESEVSFFAMHFGAAVEKKLQRQKRISVVVVCPTGIGTSRILEANLKKEFSFLDIRGVRSMFRIDTEELRQQGVDLIISTVNLTTDFPCVVVNPLLQAGDRRVIEQAILSTQAQKKESRKRTPVKELTLEDIHAITQMGLELQELLQNVKFETVKVATSRDAVIAAAGTLFAEDERMATDIENGLYERDQLADTYVKQFHALMLHCRTDMVEHARLGYLRLEPPLYEKGKVVFGAFVMLAPREESAAQPLLGAVSSLLAENKTLTDQLQMGDWDASLGSLAAGMSAYYKQQLMKRLGVEER